MGVRLPPGAPAEMLSIYWAFVLVQEHMPCGICDWESNAGAMFGEHCRRAKPRGGGQAEEAEADESRGRLPPGAPAEMLSIYWAFVLVQEHMPCGIRSFKTVSRETNYGPVAQLVERCIRIAEVKSSNLFRSTKEKP